MGIADRQHAREDVKTSWEILKKVGKFNFYFDNTQINTLTNKT